MVLYQVEVTDEARSKMRKLPSPVRQRILRLLNVLSEDPYLSQSKPLDTAKFGIELAPDMGLYRIRIESWRVVYLIEEELRLLTVLAVRKRSLYQHENLHQLIEALIEDE